MKKLLTTTALVGMLASSVAIAETKVTGSIEQAWNSISVGGTGTTGASALGQESNVKISGSKDLSNGLKLSGFIQLESNDDDTKNDATSIKVSSGAFSVEVGVDTGQHIHSNINPRVDDNPFDSLGTTGDDGMIRAQAHDKQHIGFAYKTSVGSFAVNYAPSGAGADLAAGSTTDSGGSIREYSFSGNLGVDGLKVLIGQETIEANDGDVTTAGTLEETEKVISFSYGQGPWAVGYTHRTFDDGDSASATNSIDRVTAISATYAINETLSIGVERLTGEFEDGAALKDEETTAFTVGYNLGGLGISFMYTETDHVKGASTANDNQEAFQIRTVYSF